MAEIGPNYASPGLRWGLLLEDHQGAWVEFSEAKGTDLGIPASSGGGDDFCVATIRFSAASGRPNVIGYKPVASTKKLRGDFDHPSDKWNIICTKALGRALKRAGYPDELPDLKALVVWRQRDAEICAIGSGTSQVVIAAAQPELALQAAAKSDPEAVSADDGNAPDTETVEVAEEVEPDAADATLVPPSQKSTAELRSAINGLGKASSRLTRWAKDQGIRVTKPASEHEVVALLRQAEVIAAEAAEAETEAPSGKAEEALAAPPEHDAEQLGELIAGLDDDERKAFTVFAKSLDIDPDKPDGWDANVLGEIAGWLEIG